MNNLILRYITWLKLPRNAGSVPGKVDNPAGDGWAGEQLRGRCWCPGAGSRTTVHPSRDGIIALYSVHLRPRPDTGSGFGPPSIQEVDKLVAVQARAPSQLGLEQLRYEERLKDGLGQGWLRGGWQRTET